MFTSAFKALGDLLSPEFRSVLLKALGLTIGLFIAVLIAVEVILTTLTQFSWPWADWVLALGTGAALLVAFFFLMAPVAAAFAGLFLDGIAEKVEVKHYPRDPRGVPLPAGKAILTAIQFFFVVLLVNLAVLPVVFFGIGAVALVAANAYLLSREYFEMVAMRHMTAEEARIMRRDNGPAIFMAGLLPAVLSLVPFVNLAVPLYATSYFTHLFKSVRASSV
ncbi:EI24 domain-containing protein [Aestuariivirga sp.]|uniref:EI24 domain-containing protein n=1 Tax=Aestuariivirga sp. TaxID=2650926 RepID=UPI003593E0FB